MTWEILLQQINCTSIGMFEDTLRGRFVQTISWSIISILPVIEKLGLSMRTTFMSAIGFLPRVITVGLGRLVMRRRLSLLLNDLDCGLCVYHRN